MHCGPPIGDTARQRFSHRRLDNRIPPHRQASSTPNFGFPQAVAPTASLVSSALCPLAPDHGASRTPAVGTSLRRRALARRSGRQEARVLMGLKSGAQRASIPRGVVRGLVAAVLATFIVAPSVVGASSAG